MPRITLILHNIRSSHNVGSIFRSAEGFGVEKIIITGYTPYPAIENDARLPHVRDKIASQIHKTALGAEHLVPFEHHDTIDDWLRHNDAHERLPLVALEQDKRSVSLVDYPAPPALALLLGEEVDGIDLELLNICSAIIEIPMHGKKESFNVSVAAGIALYALSSQ
jgi:23S rRNA (guanosine2251-2'-O)-methyltransferase